MRQLPTIQSLAEATPQKIHKLWEGLGYYTRVRNLQKAAQRIVAEHDGVFPNNFDAILALPGVGPYTAGAIASIAFDQPRPILDGNVIRVLTRLFAIAGNPREPKTNARLWKIAEELVTAAVPQCSHLNQSLMELGALICTPKQPKCPDCPLRTRCRAARDGLTHRLPNLGPRASATRRRFAAFIVERRGRYLVRQRPAGVVNAHLWEFPNAELRRNDSLKAAAQKLLSVKPDSLEKFFTLKHTITRYQITLDVFRARLDRPARSPKSSKHTNSVRWLKLSALRALPFPSAHRRILDILS
jgi:A/G-specific adenine glycosylase